MESQQTIEFKNKLLLGIIAIAVIAGLTIALCYHYFYSTTVHDVVSYLDLVRQAERGFIDNLPLYDDYMTPQRELKLRTYLFPAHMDVALKSGMKPVEIDAPVSDLIKSGMLQRIKGGSDRLYFFYNVRDKYRVLVPNAACGLNLLTERFQENIKLRLKLPPVKIALSSLLRPVSYQKDLRGINVNATEITTHSYGVSFDIFYDDYYVSLPVPKSSNMISRTILDTIRSRMGFLLGDALRSQFRSVLAETLMQLQDEGLLYAILEKNQHCYHVTILPNKRCPR